MHDTNRNRSKNIYPLSPVSDFELYDGEMYDNPNNIDSNEHLKAQSQQGVDFNPATLPPLPQTPYPGDIDTDISNKFINLNTSITDPKTTNKAYNQVVNQRNLSSNEGNNGILSLHTGDIDAVKRLNNLEADADVDNNSSHERQVKKGKRSPLCVCVSLVFLIAVTIGMALLVTKYSGVDLFNTEKSPAFTGPTTSPTLFPTPIPTVSPTLKPTAQPTHSPTKSPTTSSPTKSPTNAPTTELHYLTSLCSNTKKIKRTSVCVDSKNWVRCERDGSIKANDLGQLYRSCETGDVCGCTSFVRLSTGDPCVLSEDKDNSTMTCVPDS